jgi:hypothetical protein
MAAVDSNVTAKRIAVAQFGAENMEGLVVHRETPGLGRILGRIDSHGRILCCNAPDRIPSGITNRKLMDVYLIDGTYELFRHVFALPSATDGTGQEIAAVRGVLTSVLSMIEGGVTHLGVATDHVVESFRNDLYPGYKTSEGMPPELLSQFPLLSKGCKQWEFWYGRWSSTKLMTPSPQLHTKRRKMNVSAKSSSQTKILANA